MNKKRYTRVCKHCGTQYETDNYSVRYCPECAPLARHYGRLQARKTRESIRDEYAKRGEYYLPHTPIEVTTSILKDFISLYGEEMKKKYGYYLRPSWCSKARWRAFAALITHPERYEMADPSITHSYSYRASL